MTLAFQPGESMAHRLDPRSKLAVQFGFALAAFGWTDPVAPAALTVVVAGVLLASRLSPVAALREYRLALVLLAASPVVRAVDLGLPWVDGQLAVDALVAIDPGAATDAALASYRVVLVLAVSAAYVRTTPVAETRAAIQRLVPGRVGRILAAGVGFVLRFLPVLQADLGRARAASAARLGHERPLHRRMATVATAGLRRAFSRADRLSLALRARCFAWNPTPPALRLGPADAPAFALAALLAATPLLL